MVKRVLINGFGRIGRLVYRGLMASDEFKVVAVNDIQPIETLAYLLKHDSSHGLLAENVSCNDNFIRINEIEVQVFQEREPENLRLEELGVHYVIEASGFFTTRSEAQRHINAGARRVIITAPSADCPMYVMGVNHESYCPDNDTIISNASCTTNCLAPLVKVVHDKFIVQEGLMTTIHAATASQSVVDCARSKDLRGGRSVFNIIPSSTGAAKAVGKVIPDLQGRLTGMAFRVPIHDVSVVDLTIKLQTETNLDEIVNEISQASQGPMKGILGVTHEEVVSSDFLSSPYSSVFDVTSSIELNSTFFKLIAWYDNEWGYSCRTIDLLKHIASKES
jgi:glyceraldehyde 3-phosphate dehydrogenase